ncbi:hypothetical protein H7I40_00725, partial [Mycolicibacterium madagascariense]|nr:hypothetical protein [Mycolicibacterium madagascariense]
MGRVAAGGGVVPAPLAALTGASAAPTDTSHVSAHPALAGSSLVPVSSVVVAPVSVVAPAAQTPDQVLAALIAVFVSNGTASHPNGGLLFGTGYSASAGCAAAACNGGNGGIFGNGGAGADGGRGGNAIFIGNGGSGGDAIAAGGAGGAGGNGGVLVGSGGRGGSGAAGLAGAAGNAAGEARNPG